MNDRPCISPLFAAWGVVLVLLASGATYFSAYFLTVERRPSPYHRVTMMLPMYLGSRDWRIVEFFSPAHELDKTIRPNYWAEVRDPGLR